MSTFQVKLSNLTSEGHQGYLDRDTNGVPVTTSRQRQIYVMGPKKINRLLVDGQTFTDCNYWKRFCPVSTAIPEGCDSDRAFLTLTSDDGLAWSDVPAHQVYDFANLVGVAPAASPAWATVVDFSITPHFSYAKSACITNTTGASVIIRLNGITQATVANGASLIFDIDELHITKIEAQGAGGTNVIIPAAKIQIVINS